MPTPTDSEHTSPPAGRASPGRALADAIELIGSMRFAIASLSVLAIASIIGTLLRQREPFPNYVNQFGAFWAELFRAAGIYEVYNAGWFLLVLGFLVASTTLCVVRNTPKMLHEMRAWRAHVRASSLRAFHHRAEARWRYPAADAAVRVAGALKAQGYATREDVRADGTMVVGRRGGANRLGYLFAHIGIVVICLGGLLDSELPLRLSIRLLGLSPLASTAGLTEVPASATLPLANPSWRASMPIPEGGRGEHAVVAAGDGVLFQRLPFTIELERFRVEYYSTGMPKLFASDVVVVDRASGARRKATIQVNEPLIVDGIAVYQSSFDDGGSRLALRAVPLDGRGPGFVLGGEVGTSIPLRPAGPDGAAATAAGSAVPDGTRVELVGFRAVNVENLAEIDRGGERSGPAEGGDVTPAPTDPAREEVETAREAAASAGVSPSAEDRLGKRFRESVASVLSPTAGAGRRDLRNVGPSFQYKLRDPAGQAREYSMYMAPIEIGGQKLFLAGMRESPNEPFRYLRIPADAAGTMDDWLRLRAALADPDARGRAAARFADRSAPRNGAGTDRRLAEQLELSARRALDLFAEGGLARIANVLEGSVAPGEQARAAEVLARVLNGALWSLWEDSRKRAGVAAPAEDDPVAGRFLVAAQAAISDAFFFGSPLMLQLTDFREVKASVLQLTRSPGKFIVYGGSLLLVLGVFAMFYVRERRVWCWIEPTGDGGTHAMVAMSSTRRTMALDEDFARLAAALGATPAHRQVPGADTTHA